MCECFVCNRIDMIKSEMYAKIYKPTGDELTELKERLNKELDKVLMKQIN